MSGTKVNDYSISDTNIETLMLTTDQIFKGKCECTLTEMDTTTVPEIAAGSYIEVNGTLFKFDSDESISTTDPVTSSTVADGTVYIMIVPSTDTCAAAFTATAPTWSDAKQGWYGTGDYANCRYVAVCLLYSSNYVSKILFKGLPDFPYVSRFSGNSGSALSMTAGTNYDVAISQFSAADKYSYHPTVNTIGLSGNNILIPASGLYMVYFGFSFLKTTTGNYLFSIYPLINGSTSAYGILWQKNESSSTYGIIEFYSANMLLSKNDTLGFRLWCDSAASVDFSNIRTYFEIKKL